MNTSNLLVKKVKIIYMYYCITCFKSEIISASKSSNTGKLAIYEQNKANLCLYHFIHVEQLITPVWSHVI